MRRQLATAATAALVLLAGMARSQAQVLYFEGFEGVTLQDSVNERIGTRISERVATTPGTSAIPGVWSGTLPTGWTRDNTLSTYDGSPTVTPGVPGVGLADYGVDEWEGWNLTRMDFWSEKDDQERSMFGTTSGASGTIAVADPDEYFDLGSQNDPVNGGYYSSSLTTKSFPVNPGALHGLGFDSSWRDEAFDDSALGDTYVDLNNQAVEIIVTYDTGYSEQITKWNSDSNDAFFKNDAPDESFAAGAATLGFVAPGDATSATISFNIANAANDWWWAIDNVEVVDVTGGTGQKMFEDFEGVTLGDSVNERLAPGANVKVPSDGTTTILGTEYPTSPHLDAFTHTFPADWTVDNTGTPGAGGGDDGFGVFEWEQWSIADKNFWSSVGGSTRNQFDKATGNVAVADGDKWEELGDDGNGNAPNDLGDLMTLMRTPSIDVSGEGVVTIDFDSSWRPEDFQEATLVALLDGTPTELLHWSSEKASPDYHGSAVNEDVGFLLDTTGFSSLQLEFRYDGNNDWWWAVDNIRVQSGAVHSLVPEPSSLLLAGLVACGLAAKVRSRKR